MALVSVPDTRDRRSSARDVANGHSSSADIKQESSDEEDAKLDSDEHSEETTPEERASLEHENGDEHSDGEEDLEGYEMSSSEGHADHLENGNGHIEDEEDSDDEGGMVVDEDGCDSNLSAEQDEPEDLHVHARHVNDDYDNQPSPLDVKPTTGLFKNTYIPPNNPTAAHSQSNSSILGSRLSQALTKPISKPLQKNLQLLTATKNYQRVSQVTSSIGTATKTVSDEEDEESFDDREGCRSLICDRNGIIVAEMVYRCMICSYFSDAIGEAQRHYQIKHIAVDANLGLPPTSVARPLPNKSAATPKTPSSAPSYMDNYDPNSRDEFGDEDSSLSGELSPSTVTYQVPAGLKQLQSLQTSTPNDEPKSLLRKPGNFVHSPAPSSLNGSVGSQNLSQSKSESRGGYVTCAVCNITKYYASVQRRYGQFTCMGCAKFFGRFLLKPRHYFCPDLGSCTLDVSPRCKACLLLACINTYHIDDKRMKIVNGNRPLRRAPSIGQHNGVLSPVRIPAQQEAAMALKRKALQPNVLMSPSATVRSQPPPLIRAPSYGRLNRSSLQSSTRQSVHNARVAQAISSQSTLRNQQSSAIKPQHANNLTRNLVTPNMSEAIAASRAQLGNRKGSGCRNCQNCLAEDCGVCNYCLDKPKYGGPNTLKKKCIRKKCQVGLPLMSQQKIPTRK